MNGPAHNRTESTGRRLLRLIFLATCPIPGALAVTVFAFHVFPLPSKLMAHVEKFSDSDAEVLFIGSSFTGLGVDPEVLREHGVRAFVFGVPALGGEELEYVLGEALERRPETLRSVWVEVKQWEPETTDGRSRHWRTPSPVGRGLMAIGAYDGGAWIIHPEPGRRRRVGQLFDFRGHARWIDPDEGDVDWPLQFELQKLIQSNGLDPVFFLPPTRVQPEPYVFDIEDFNNPARFPELFEDEVRWDPTHLNLEGARRWSEMIAARIRAKRGSESV